MDNPFLRRRTKSKTSHGAASEKRLAKSTGSRLTPGSGALDGAKGDMSRGNLLIEAKSTIKASMSIKYEWLQKITKEAKGTSQVPAVTISFVHGSGEAKHDGDWVMIPKALFDALEEL
jgi:hypothetical protein